MITRPIMQRPQPASLGLESFLVGLLLLILLDALGVPEWLVLVTDAPVPWLNNILPYFAPLLLAAMMFNTITASRLHGGRIFVFPEALLFILFVVAAFAIELGHIVSGGEFRIWLHMGFFWMLMNYLGLHSFCPMLPNCREWTVVLCIGLGLCVAVLDFLAVVIFSPGWGIAPFGLNPNQLFDSAYVAYLAAFAFALVLFERPANTGTIAWVQYGVVAPVLAWAVHLQRLTGPTILIFALVGLKCLTVIRSNSLRMFVFAGILLPLACITLYGFACVQNPTLKGLAGGPYYFDEVGSVHGDVISSYIRREAILQELRLFLDSPLLGIGVGRAMKVQVLMNGMHSNLVYLLVSTGLFGFALFVLVIVWAMSRSAPEQGLKVLALPMIMGMAMLLAPEAMGWWAVTMFLISSRPSCRPGLPGSNNASEMSSAYVSLARLTKRKTNFVLRRLGIGGANWLSTYTD